MSSEDLIKKMVEVQDTILKNTKRGRVEAIMHPDLAKGLGIEGETVFKCYNCNAPAQDGKAFCGPCEDKAAP